MGSMADPSTTCLATSNSSPPVKMRPDAEPDDNSIVLTPDQALQVDHFCHELRLCETDTNRYNMCVQKRDEQLDQYTKFHILIATCEHVMSVECPEYRQRKQTDKDASQPSPISKDDAGQWDRFRRVAANGLKIKSKCLSALKEVVRCWGLGVVQHYQWASKGEKYWNQLRITARRVHVWEEAVIGLNWSIVQRSRLRPVKASVNPIEQADLESLRAWSLKNPVPYKKLATEDLPDGLGFDKFGLIVYKEYTTQIDSDTDDTVAELMDTFLTKPTDITTNASHDQPNTEPAEDTSAPPEALSVSHSSGDTKPAPSSTGMTLRKRPRIDYWKLSGGGGLSKPKQARLQLVTDPKSPPRCCPADVPSTLLSALDNNPSTFGLETAEQFSPFIAQLCRPHLQLLTTRTSAIALSQKPASMRKQDISGANISIGANRPVRRRATSLQDVTQHISKRARFDVDSSFPSVPTARSDIAIYQSKQDRPADDAYRRQVLAELQEKFSQDMGDSHGKETDKLIRELLEKVEQPNTDRSQGVVEAMFCTGDEAASLAESGSHGVPIITEGQQQFQWSKGDRPIIQLFRRIGGLEKTVSVQVPSRSSTTESYEDRKLSEVRARFFDQKDTDDPWNILDLQSPLPQSILPNFLTGENCQLLLQVRNTVLMEKRAERVVASAQKWNEWRNVLEWVLLSEGGHNTAPHTDSHGFATWITAQEESIGFGWMSSPTEEEWEAWTSDPHCYTGGRWRYVVLKPGQSVFFMPGTIHFVFRVRGRQTLAVGGHILQWSGIQQWMQVVLSQMRNPAITNEEMRRSAPKLVHVIAKLVAIKVDEGGVEELGGEAAIEGFFASVKEFDKSYNRAKKRRVRG